MGLFKILNRFSGKVLFELECKSLKSCVEVAVKNGASLDGAGLYGANLAAASLEGASLDGANLDEANLDEANLVGASLVGASLDGASLDGASLVGANLDGVKKLHYQNCPEEGSFIAFKKGRKQEIIKLEIPAKAKRTSSIIGRKCRAELAKIISIEKNGEQLESCDNWSSKYLMRYRVGFTVTADGYNDDPRLECTNGIHFFISKQEAIDW